MQDLGRKNVRYINHAYKRSGTLWKGRYKAGLVDSEAYLLTFMQYSELKPVRASMVKHPGEYYWSSYGANAYGKTNPLIQPHLIYSAIGKGEAERQFSYRELFINTIGNEAIHNIRESLNQELVLGREDF